MASNSELRKTKFGIRLNDEQIETIEKLCKTYCEKWNTMPNLLRYERLNYDSIVRVLETMIKTGNNFAKTYIQLYFKDIREKYNFYNKY